MARIRTLKSEQRSASSPHPTTVDARWQVVRPPGGDVLLQISTYGSDQRQSEPKVSQTVQVDRAVATELFDILRRTFDL